MMGADPYEGFDATQYSLQLSGWHSSHPYFESILRQAKPRLILEVGTWLGASAIHMARIARQLDPLAQVLCIDTWLGSHEVLWFHPEYREQLRLRHGYPQQYYQFLANVVLSGMQDAIYGLPMTSYAATRIIAKCSMRFDVIYIDAHHDEDEVLGDVRRCYEILRPGGFIFGDDYGNHERGVIRAVNRFASEQGLYLNTSKEKWAFQKPPDGNAM